jgi:hypothetical protein
MIHRKTRRTSNIEKMRIMRRKPETLLLRSLLEDPPGFSNNIATKALDWGSKRAVFVLIRCHII